MSRYINADALKAHYAWWQNEEQKTFDEIVDVQPTADVRENVKGEWKIYCDDKGVVQDCYCDQCGFNSVIGGNFCPNCGASMRTADSEQQSILAEGGKHERFR